MPPEGWAAAVGTWAEPRLGALVLAGGALALLLLAAVAALGLALGRAARRYRQLAAGVEGGNLERLLEAQAAALAAARAEVARQAGALGELAERQRGCLQRVGLVRYDAFADVGGQVSFALALLDQRGDGVVLNSLFGREGSSVYAKPLAAGRAPVALAEEEQQALREAAP